VTIDLTDGSNLMVRTSANQRNTWSLTSDLNSQNCSTLRIRLMNSV